MKLVDVYSVEDAADVLYRVLEERPSENCISHEQMPTPEQHAAFMATKPFRYWYVIKAECGYVGSIEVTHQNEIGVSILKRFHRQGHGELALKLFISNHEPAPAVPALRNGHWLANVAVNNNGSREFFRRMGFKTIQHTMLLP